ncbi:hypothetical protein ACCC13_000186 [Yersinia enterocolitica]
MIGAWYRTGTITAPSGQNVITGSGTQWANNVMGVAIGQALYVTRSDGNTLVYEILAVDSDTKIRINGNVVDALSASNYGIQTSVANSYSALARETSAQLALYQQLLQDWQLITTGTGNVSIIAPDGTEVVIPALSWISDSKTWFDTNKELIENAGEAVAGALSNLGLGDAAQRKIGTGSENVPDITAADKRYLKQSGGTVVGDAAPIIIRAATLNAALYLLAQQSDGSGAWYLGMPVAENNRLVLRSYANNCEISLSSGRGDITVPLYIEGGKAYYPGNKPPLTNVWVSGEYTPVMGTPTVVNHGLAGIDVLHCKADVLLKCVTADAGYSPGDFAAGWSIHSSANAATVGFPALSTTTIQTNTGAAGTGLLVNGKGGGGSYSAVLANWRYILRIFY